MGTDQNPKCAQDESVAPATALAYLDPKYWSVSTLEFLSDSSSFHYRKFSDTFS